MKCRKTKENKGFWVENICVSAVTEKGFFGWAGRNVVRSDRRLAASQRNGRLWNLYGQRADNSLSLRRLVDA
ncbi:MAG TPA: hypothetical protein VHY84_17420 [Bryobacteraceae bacterium]|jgi:hypothetical protein|nr:hypothetical protein [Bryobacteraceae bacterium]